MYFCMNVIPMLKVQQRLFQVGMEVQQLTRALPLSIVSSHLNQNKLECYNFDLLSQQILDVFFRFLLAKAHYFDQQYNLIMSAVHFLLKFSTLFGVEVSTIEPTMMKEG